MLRPCKTEKGTKTTKAEAALSSVMLTPCQTEMGTKVTAAWLQKNTHSVF